MNDPTARGLAERALKLVPNNPVYGDTLGWILVSKGEVESGLRYLREARLRSPDNVEIRFHLAFALAKIGRKEEAREELSAVLGGSRNIANNPQVAILKRELGI
jgi:Flp pilus assembly protein TadD